MELTLWLVDDDPVCAFIIKKIWHRMKSSGNLLHFGNGQLAFDSIKENLTQPQFLPDIILLDLRMPVMNGWEFMQAFSALYEHSLRNTKIYIVSSSSDMDDIEMSQQYSQIADYIVKPISQQQLEKILYAAVA